MVIILTRRSCPSAPACPSPQCPTAPACPSAPACIHNTVLNIVPDISFDNVDGGITVDKCIIPILNVRCSGDFKMTECYVLNGTIALGDTSRERHEIGFASEPGQPTLRLNIIDPTVPPGKYLAIRLTNCYIINIDIKGLSNPSSLPLA